MEGFNTTHDHLKVKGFHFTGTNPTPDTREKCLILSSNGIKFGLPAVTLRVNKSLPKGKDYLVNIILFHRFQGKVDLSLLEEQISYCQSKACDFIIVSLHWGMEFEFFPRQDQVDIAHHLIEYGADAIISHHAHNIQPYEIYQTHRDPYRKAPIFYGLGNLSSKWPNPQFSLSLIVNFSVVKGHVKNIPKTLVSSVNVSPVLQLEYDCKNKRFLQIEKMSDLIKSARGEERGQFINDAGKYADLIIGRNWRK
jgi:poly-gamma-glutamate synthesis protein (capsule biosynthesis protein)